MRMYVCVCVYMCVCVCVCVCVLCVGGVSTQLVTSCSSQGDSFRYLTVLYVGGLTYQTLTPAVPYRRHL